MFSFLKRNAPVSVASIKEAIQVLTEGFFNIEDIKLSENGHAIVVLQPLPDVQGFEVQRHTIERTVSEIKGIKKILSYFN